MIDISEGKRQWDRYLLEKKKKKTLNKIEMPHQRKIWDGAKYERPENKQRKYLDNIKLNVKWWNT